MDASLDSKEVVCDTHGKFESRAIVVLGRVMCWSSCPDCNAIERAERDAKKQAEEAQERQRRLEAKLNQSGIPLRFRAKTFETFTTETDGKEKARAAAMTFAASFKEHRKHGTFMVFSGKPGTGKSHLAVSIAQAIMPGQTVLYTSAIDAVRMIRDTWRRDSAKTERQVLDELASIDLLILDEVGVQYGTEAEQVSLFDIIDKRYRDLMPTILLTNLNAKGMKEFLGDRSYDRLRENGLWVTFDWESQRKRAA